jgi:hypothetical protein
VPLIQRSVGKDALASSKLGDPIDVIEQRRNLHVMHKYNNVAQLGHFHGEQNGFKTCLTIF